MSHPDPTTPAGSDADATQVVVMPASTRDGSFNRALAHAISARLADHGSSATVLDLRDHPMPLYDADAEARDGVPATARTLAARLADASVLVVVSPEYNGTFSPLLKNTIDWITRVDVSALAHLTVLVAAASPGAGGGANGVEMVRTWMSNMGVPVAEHALTVGSVDPAAGVLAGVHERDLDRFLEQAVRSPATV